ncbi:unnamed protein product [Eruca vesicaria subsp. sativa]|uniref:RBR-type E3 ubiquitin transferase n=1 Tax=Eruca vesicaria subsp. sativa TaxID=29727 RepID=A0ABC8JLR7_ERUVS|nr:unnamed protein product [Eruca vesicaria subsp. sativa]
MEFLRPDSDSEYAFRLQMEEALAASLSSRSRTPYRPPSPPVVATSGFAIVVDNGSSTPETVRRRNTTSGEGNSRGKTVSVPRGDARNPNSKVGNFQNAFVRPSPTRSVAAGEGSSKVGGGVRGGFRGDVMYRVYFKGLVSEESGSGKGKVSDLVAGFGVAICDQRDVLLFELKGQLVGRGANRQGAEIQALTRGLTEAWKLGIKHVSIFCDSFPIFQYVRGIWTPKQKKIAMLMDDLQRIRQQFSFSQAVLVAGNEVKYAYKLARESIVSQETPPLENPRQAKVARKEECLICFNDIDPERMFSIGKCNHRFCFQCVKQHVEVKLLHGMIPNCPHDKCKCEMVIDACGKLLTPKLGDMWKQRIKENAIPVTERVYCPYLRCSALMSKTKISESAKSLQSAYPASGVRRCVECRGLFCVDCKVPWHGKMSCTEYKKLHPNPPADDVKLKSLASNKMWRQCGKCQHMIELSQGCNHITCRCGHEFCYNCGGGWNQKTGTCVKQCPTWNEAYIMRQDPGRAYVAPNNYFDDHDDDEEDDDYEADEDFDYGYGDYPFNLGQHMNDVNPEEPFDPFFDLPDGVLFLPHMLSPRSRQQFYDSDDNSDDEETGQPPHLRQSNAPSGNETTRVNAHLRQSNAPSGNETTRLNAHLRQSNAPSGNETTRVNAPLEEEEEEVDDCPYFGGYGEYGIVYDSDGYEIEDYSNPFHPDNY